VRFRYFGAPETASCGPGTIHFFAIYPLKSSDYNEDARARAMEGRWDYIGNGIGDVVTSQSIGSYLILYYI